MQERRKLARSRTYLGGVVAFNRRRSTMSCLVRNLSRLGGKIVFEGAVTIPAVVELSIPHLDRRHQVRIVWRRLNEAGVMVLDTPVAPLPLDFARKLRAAKAENDALRQRIAQLSSAE